MTRFRTAVEEWRGLKTDGAISLVRCNLRIGFSGLAGDILLYVVKAVDAYERTIAQLKKQNTKLRRDRKAVAEAGRPG